MLNPAMINRRRWLLLQATATLLLGGWIYISSREEGLLMFWWLSKVGLQPVVDLLREHTGLGVHHADWLRFSLPDGLWVYSGTCLMMSVWKGRLHRGSAPWLAAPLSLGAGAEIAQAARLLPGTFDVVDLGLVVLAGALALIQLEAGACPNPLAQITAVDRQRRDVQGAPGARTMNETARRDSCQIGHF